MKDINYIKDYYNKYYTNGLNFYWKKTKILNAFKTYEDDMPKRGRPVILRAKRDKSN